MKCLVNENNEITNVWVDTQYAPEGALECEVPHLCTGHMDESESHVNHYTLVDGVVSRTAAGTSYMALAYTRDRQYPAIGDQLDMIFHAGLGGDEFQAAIQAVKDANPKP